MVHTKPFSSDCGVKYKARPDVLREEHPQVHKRFYHLPLGLFVGLPVPGLGRVVHLHTTVKRNQHIFGPDTAGSLGRSWDPEVNFVKLVAVEFRANPTTSKCQIQRQRSM
jgi:hypothetical protein